LLRRGSHHDSGLLSSGNKVGRENPQGREVFAVIFWNIGDERETTTQDGTKETSRPFLLRYYNVFQFVAGGRHRHPASLLQETRTNDPHRNVRTTRGKHAGLASVRAIRRSVVLAEQRRGRYAGTRPLRSSEDYYATAFHELAHSTGHAKRLHRENFDNQFPLARNPTRKKKLIAEMTAAMLCGIAGIEQRILENSAAISRRGLRAPSWIRAFLFLLPHMHRKLRTSSKARLRTSWQKRRRLKVLTKRLLADRPTPLANKRLIPPSVLLLVSRVIVTPHNSN